MHHHNHISHLRHHPRKQNNHCWCTHQRTNKITLTYYPMCTGSGIPPASYHLLDRPYMRKLDSALDFMIKFSHFNILPKIFDPSALDHAIHQLNINEDEKQHLLGYTSVHDLIINILHETFGILSLFNENVSIEELQTILATKYQGFWRPSLWWSIIDNLMNVMNIEQDQKSWAKRSRNNRAPHLAECGIHIATANGFTLGSIWTFYDPRMVSKDGSILYVFAQGIRSSIPYIIARTLHPKALPLTSQILIDAVEAWARAKGANAIRINPIENMNRILTRYHQFTPLTPAAAAEISPFLQTELKQKSIYQVIKHL